MEVEARVAAAAERARVEAQQARFAMKEDQILEAKRKEWEKLQPDKIDETAREFITKIRNTKITGVVNERGGRFIKESDTKLEAILYLGYQGLIYPGWWGLYGWKVADEYGGLITFLDLLKKKGYIKYKPRVSTYKDLKGRKAPQVTITIELLPKFLGEFFKLLP